MKKVFLGLFCLSLVSSVVWVHHSEGEQPKVFSIEELTYPVLQFLSWKGEQPEVFSIEELGLSFQKIKAGSFTMGSPEDEEGRSPNENQVEVTISSAFAMLETEVTQMQYFLVTREKPSYFSGPEYCDNYDEVNEICPDHPVDSVSWYDAKKFIELLNASAGVKGCKGTPKDPRGCYRLPTEAEYEKAVRAGTETAYFFENDSIQLDNYAVYSQDNSGGLTYEMTTDRDNSGGQTHITTVWDNNSGGQTHKVTFGKKNPNKLHGIIGNVSEWTADIYKPELEGGKDPLNMSKEHVNGCCRVIRGGSWFLDAKFLRSATRDGLYPYSRDNVVGFRLVRTL